VPRLTVSAVRRATRLWAVPPRLVPRSPWTGLLLGSVSMRCAAGAACPVVLVKVPGEMPVSPATP
jgi:nucleotide-binding universal stress UspA family protein